MAHWPMTLSGGILAVLKDAANGTALTADVAAAINARRTTIQKDGGEVFAHCEIARLRDRKLS